MHTAQYAHLILSEHAAQLHNRPHIARFIERLSERDPVLENETRKLLELPFEEDVDLELGSTLQLIGNLLAGDEHGCRALDILESRGLALITPGIVIAASTEAAQSKSR